LGLLGALAWAAIQLTADYTQLKTNLVNLQSDVKDIKDRVEKLLQSAADRAARLTSLESTKRDNLEKAPKGK